MTPEEYQRAKNVLRLIDAADISEREPILDRECGDDSEFRSKVEAFLKLQQHETGFLDQPLVGRMLRDAVEGMEDSAAERSPPSSIGRYRIIRVLGRGGMGIVYEAEQDEPRRTVALKVIPWKSMSAEGLRRFRNEAHMLGRLHHSGIAQVYDSGTADTGEGAQPFIAMEYIRGKPLNDYAKDQHLSMRDSLALMARVCDAVHHAHLKGVIHRDLKPGNIVVTELGDPKILDFGVARATDSDLQITTMMTLAGQLIGTVPYMSPEQVGGDPDEIDARCDVYALGVNLFELLSGRLPYDLERRTIPEAARIIQEEDPLRLSSMGFAFRGDVDTIVATAIEKQPERRYQSAESLGADIRRFLDYEPIVARPVSTVYRFRKFMRRHKAIVGGVLTTMLVLLAGVMVATILAIRANELANIASENEQRALEGEALARWMAYRVSIAAASSAIAAQDPISAAKILKDVPEDLRNWEWHYFRARLDPVLASASFIDADNDSGHRARMAFRPDGTPLVASALDGVAQLTNLIAGDAFGEFHAGASLRLPSLSPDGSLLAAVSESAGEVIVWDVRTGEEQSRILAQASTIDRMSFSLDSSLLELSGDLGVTAHEVRTGRALFTYEFNRASRCGQAEFSADGTRLFLWIHSRAESAHGTILVLDVQTGALLEAAGFLDMAGGFALSPDGRTLVAGTGAVSRFIRVLDAVTLEQVAVLRGHSDSITDVAFSQSGDRLVSLSGDMLLLWDATRWENIGSQQLEDIQGESIALNHDGSRIIVAGEDAAQLLDLNLDSATVLRGHPTFVYLVAFHPDGTLIASADFNREVRLWDAITGEPVTTIEVAASSSLAFSKDGTQLLSAPGGDVMRVGDPIRWQETAEQIDSSQYFSLARGGSKRVLDWQGEGEASSPDGTLHLHVGAKGEIIIRDLETQKELRRLRGHGDALRAVAASPNNALCVSSGDDAIVRVWDLATGVELAAMQGHTDKIYSVNFSPDGSRIVSGGNDNTIILWDVETFDQVAELRGHTSYVHSVAFSPDGTQIVSGSGDTTVRIWDSVPLAERRKQTRAAEALREEMTPMVDRLLEELGEPLNVAEHLRGDETLYEPSRRAALRVLLQRSTAQ